MLRTYRYRLYPNQRQRECIYQNAGACRFVYNWALETKKTAYETDRTNLSWYDLNNRLKDLKRDYPFLQNAYSQSLQQAIKRLDLAFQHFFRRIKMCEKQLGYPKFRRRKHHCQSFDVPQFFIELADREWICAMCGTSHDRDLNAAQNIKLMGLCSLRTPREPREEPVELSALAEAVKQEAPP